MKIDGVEVDWKQIEKAESAIHSILKENCLSDYAKSSRKRQERRFRWGLRLYILVRWLVPMNKRMSLYRKFTGATGG